MTLDEWLERKFGDAHGVVSALGKLEKQCAVRRARCEELAAWMSADRWKLAETRIRELRKELVEFDETVGAIPPAPLPPVSLRTEKFGGEM